MTISVFLFIWHSSCKTKKEHNRFMNDFEYYCADLLRKRGFQEVEAAKKLKILLWDRGYLESMIEER